jgi:dihydrolipoamide dehydrogenase
MKEFDIAIIGGGPGGYVAAIKAAQQGACVCLIEADRVGGTCLNRGCIPTKAYYSTAVLLNKLRHADQHGVITSGVEFDFARAAERKDQVVEKLVGGVDQLLKGNKVEVFRGKGFLEGEGKVGIRRPDVVGHIRAKKIILATGSLPVTPKSLPVDGKNVLTSTEILAIKELPKRLLVIGGGYIGCEFASIFATFGTEVTIVEALPNILANSDRQIVREVEKAFRDLDVKIHLKTSVESLEVKTDSVTAQLSGQQQLVVDKVLVAVGRRPNSSGMNFAECGIQLDDGAVVVDDQLRTSVEGIYAIGDVIGGIQLAHVASYQAEIAVKNALGGNEKVDYRVVPSAIFTLPEVAQVGLTEEQCKVKGLAYQVGRFSYQATSKAICEGEIQGSIKVIADEATGQILGAAIAGAEASALISELAVAMAQGVSAHQLGAVIHAHPTLPEMIKEAVEDVTGLAVHKIGRRR